MRYSPEQHTHATRLLSVWADEPDSPTKRIIIAEQLRVLEEVPDKDPLYYRALADLIDCTNNLDALRPGAAKAIRNLLAQVEERDRRIEALEHCLVVVGDDVAVCDPKTECNLIWSVNGFPCGRCTLCDPAAFDRELQVQR